jgi:homopolymeric O-antigen transport system permease protein
VASTLSLLLDPRRHHHAFRFFGELAHRYRPLIWELTKREIAERYVGQVLGVAWAVGHPLISIAVYIFVFAYIIRIRIGGSAEAPFDYTTYLLSGLMPWLTFTDIVNRACSSVTANAGLVKQVLFPVEILPIKTVTAALVTQLVATAGLLIYILAMHGFLRTLTLLLPVVFAIEVIGLIGLAYALSAVTVFFRDLKDIIVVLTGIGMYISPILFSEAAVPSKFYWLMLANPFSYVAWVYQDTIFYGRFLHPWAWITFTVMSFACLSLGFRLFRVLRPSFGDLL